VHALYPAAEGVVDVGNSINFGILFTEVQLFVEAVHVRGLAAEDQLGEASKEGQNGRLLVVGAKRAESYALTWMNLLATP